MPASASARRYASAAFTVAERTGDFDAWLATLDEVSRVLRVPSARTIFLSPTVPASQKAAALERLVPKATPIMRNFLRILIDRDRLAAAPGMAEAFRELINQRRGIITAEVTTAVPLDAELERQVASRLAAYFGRDPQQVSIRAHVDAAIIGGVVARIGDQVIDDSVRGRLERLRRTLAG